MRRGKRELKNETTIKGTASGGNFGKSLVNGEVTHDNAADMTESFNTSLNTDVAQ